MYIKNNMNNNQGPCIPTFQEVTKVAYITKQDITAMWGNEAEFNKIDTIVLRVRNGALWCAEAILQIQEIPKSKHGDGGHGLEW